jgi:hypothetical protein
MEHTYLSIKLIEEALKNRYITYKEAMELKQNYKKEFDSFTK